MRADIVVCRGILVISGRRQDISVAFSVTWTPARIICA